MGLPCIIVVTALLDAGGQPMSPSSRPLRRAAPSSGRAASSVLRAVVPGRGLPIAPFAGASGGRHVSAVLSLRPTQGGGEAPMGTLAIGVVPALHEGPLLQSHLPRRGGMSPGGNRWQAAPHGTMLKIDAKAVCPTRASSERLRAVWVWRARIMDPTEPHISRRSLLASRMPSYAERSCDCRRPDLARARNSAWVSRKAVRAALRTPKGPSSW